MKCKTFHSSCWLQLCTLPHDLDNLVLQNTTSTSKFSLWDYELLYKAHPVTMATPTPVHHWLVYTDAQHTSAQSQQTDPWLKPTVSVNRLFLRYACQTSDNYKPEDWSVMGFWTQINIVLKQKSTITLHTISSECVLCVHSMQLAWNTKITNCICHYVPYNQIPQWNTVKLTSEPACNK